MLNNLSRALSRAGLLALASLLGACTPTPQLPQALKLEASYQLTFNEALVGHVIFGLDIAADGQYQIEAFTTPAGAMGKAGDLEVLEVSRGNLDIDRVRPVHFEHSVMQNERLEVVSLSFDWEGHQLKVFNGKASQQLGLLPNTHDRLSYLLIAGRLSRETGGELRHIQVASVEATEETVLQPIGQADVEVPLGHFDGDRHPPPDPGRDRRTRTLVRPCAQPAAAARGAPLGRQRGRDAAGVTASRGRSTAGRAPSE